MSENWKNKSVLITAGSTWVPIDSVRVITNIFSGSLGLELAREAASRGAKVLLLFGGSLPTQEVSKYKNLKVVNFRYFSEFEKLFKKHVATKAYDILIHSAAVSDYGPKKVVPGKIKSDKRSLTVKLERLPKLVDLVKKLDPDIFLVKFKLEVGVSASSLIDTAYKSMKKSKADLMVANAYKLFSKERVAYIVDNDKVVKKVVGKNNIVQNILNTIQDEYKRIFTRN